MEQYLTSRSIDELGRVVLPIEVRKSLNLSALDSVEIWIDDSKEQIILRKSYNSPELKNA